jgi:hypothetical protein
MLQGQAHAIAKGDDLKLINTELFGKVTEY